MPADAAPLNGNGSRDGNGKQETAGSATPPARRPTLNTAVRRRRADRAFYIRLAGAIRQNAAALKRLER